jgi:hypothetical protein
MRYTARCGDASMRAGELRLPKSPRHRTTGAERMLRLLDDSPTPERTPGDRPVRQE